MLQEARRRSLKLARLVGCPEGGRAGTRDTLNVSHTLKYNQFPYILMVIYGKMLNLEHLEHFSCLKSS